MHEYRLRLNRCITRTSTGKCTHLDIGACENGRGPQGPSPVLFRKGFAQTVPVDGVFETDAARKQARRHAPGSVPARHRLRAPRDKDNDLQGVAGKTATKWVRGCWPRGPTPVVLVAGWWVRGHRLVRLLSGNEAAGLSSFLSLNALLSLCK